MAKFEVKGPGKGEEKEESPAEEKKEHAGCPFYMGGSCQYLERPIESLMEEGGDGAGEMEEAEADED